MNTIAPTQLMYLFVEHMKVHGKQSSILSVASVASFFKFHDLPSTEFMEQNNQTLVGGTSSFRTFEKAALCGLSSARASKAVIIPGFMNYLQMTLLVKLMPLFLRIQIISFVMSFVVSEKKK